MRQLGFIAIAACIKYELTFSEIRAHERALLSHNNIIAIALAIGEKL